jgi:hypothetical protein
MEKLGISLDQWVSVQEEDYDSIVWKDDPKCTKKEWEDAKIDLVQEYDAQAYSRKREAEYPSLQECVHAILDDTLDALQAKRAEIKTKFPKG